ncbi:hypothetical protein ADUPG1_006998, partial [Aduncisulcus paluster]
MEASSGPKTEAPKHSPTKKSTLHVKKEEVSDPFSDLMGFSSSPGTFAPAKPKSPVKKPMDMSADIMDVFSSPGASTSGPNPFSTAPDTSFQTNSFIVGSKKPTAFGSQDPFGGSNPFAGTYTGYTGRRSSQGYAKTASDPFKASKPAPKTSDPFDFL